MKKQINSKVGFLALILLLTSNFSYAGERDIKFSKACAPGVTVTLSAVGDVLMHSALQRQADKSSNGFKTNFMEAIPYLQASDVAYANLEGPVAPGISCRGGEYLTKIDSPLGGDCGKNRNAIYTGYPRFNYHPSIISDLIESGVDVVSAANNHSLDRKSVGVDKTVEALTSYQLPFTGIRDSAGNGKWHTVTKVKGKKIAWLSCTEMVNGERDPHKQVLRCFTSSVEKQVKNLSNSFDAVVVTPHWGSEYRGKPNRSQKEYARKWLEAGATAILGAHPHVVQPWEKYMTSDGRETLIVYSLGNFVSNQGISGKPYAFSSKQATAIVYFGITFANQNAWINGVRYVPAYMRNRATNHKKLVVSTLNKSKKENETLSFLSKYFGTERISRSVKDLKTNMECK